MVYFLYHKDDSIPELPDFEFDEDKSRMNLEKHGIDFVQALALWLDRDRVEGPARSEGEDRFMVVGLIDGRHSTAFVTYRGDRVRLISVRRSRPSEVARYDHHH